MMRTLSSTVVGGCFGRCDLCLNRVFSGREPDLPGLSQAVRMQLY
jgi:hypothetical protein